MVSIWNNLMLNTIIYLADFFSIEKKQWESTAISEKTYIFHKELKYKPASG